MRRQERRQTAGTSTGEHVLVSAMDYGYGWLRPSKYLKLMATKAALEYAPLYGGFLGRVAHAARSAAVHSAPPKEVDGPLYLLGPEGNGTAALGIVLSIHREVAYLDDSRTLWKAAGACFAPALRADGDRFPEPAATEDLRARARQLYGALLVATRSKRVVDRFRHGIFHAPFLREVFPEGRFLVMVRNGWSACAPDTVPPTGFRTRPCDPVGSGPPRDQRERLGALNRAASADPDWNSLGIELEGLTNPSDLAAAEWVLSMRAGLRLLEACPDRALKLRYEDLVAEGEEALLTVESFSRWDYDEGMRSYGHQVFGSQWRAKPVPFSLAEAVRPLFLETQDRLGYKP